MKIINYKMIDEGIVKGYCALTDSKDVSEKEVSEKDINSKDIDLGDNESVDEPQSFQFDGQTESQSFQFDGQTESQTGSRVNEPTGVSLSGLESELGDEALLELEKRQVSIIDQSALPIMLETGDINQLGLYKNIDPSPLRLIVLTSCNCNLHCNININVVFHQLDIDETVETIKLEQHIKGKIKEPKKKQKKKTKNKDKKKKHFINQITIVISHQNQLINVKLFGNGKIVVTGAKDLNMIKIMLGILVQKIRHLTQVYRIDDSLQIGDLFTGSQELVKFMEKNSLLILQLIFLLDLDMPINWNNLLVNKSRNRLLELKLSIEEFVEKELFIEEKSEKHELLEVFCRLIQTVKVVKLYSYNIIANKRVQEDIINLFRGKSVEFPVSYDQFPEEKSLEIVVNNYNALFESNIKFDRDKFHYVLTNRCGILVNYRPSSYQGLNITYYLTHNGQEQKVTFFAFQDGTVMITGNNNWEVIKASYYQMCQIIDKYYDEIVSNEKRIAKTANLPVKFEQVVDNVNYTFLNKKSLVINNPRNNYILKSKGLIKHYLMGGGTQVTECLIPP